MSSLGRAHRSGYTGASARNALRSFRPARVAPWSWIGRGRQIHASAAQGSGHQQRIQPCTNAGEGGCACEQHDPLPLTCFAGVEAGWEDPSSFSSALRQKRTIPSLTVLATNIAAKTEQPLFNLNCCVLDDCCVAPHLGVYLFRKLIRRQRHDAPLLRK